MPTSEQILKYIADAAPVNWVFLFASYTVIIIKWYAPNLFDGLPEWFCPLVVLIAIITTFTCALSQRVAAFNLVKLTFGLLIQPVQKKCIRNKLLKIDFGELLVISLAVEKMDRALLINRDHPVALSLLDKELIESPPIVGGIVIKDNNMTSFSIPQNVWKIILKMPEFQLPISNTSQAPTFPIFPLQRAVKQSQPEAFIKKLLPQHHPAISK